MIKKTFIIILPCNPLQPFYFSLILSNETTIPLSACLIAKAPQLFESCFRCERQARAFSNGGCNRGRPRDGCFISRIINCTRRGIHRDAYAWYTRVFILRSEMHADRLTYYDGNGVTTGIARRMSFPAGISVSLERATWAHFARLPFNRNVCAY